MAFHPLFDSWFAILSPGSGRQRRAQVRWPLSVVRALVAAASLAFGPTSAAAQTDDAGAWWAHVTSLDAPTACGAELAWVHAMHVKNQAERDLSTDGLAAVLSGPELAREQRAVGALEEAGRGLDRVEVESWTVMGGSSDELVLYATLTDRMVEIDPSTARPLDADEWVEEVQVAFRMRFQDAAWRLADEHVFEKTRHTVGVAALDDLTLIYGRLWVGLATAYNARDTASLESVLAGQALEVYQRRVQARLDDGGAEQLPFSGWVSVLDLQDGSATAFFEAGPDQTAADQTSAQPDPGEAALPLEVVHHLRLEDEQWKIVDEMAMTAHTNADGTVHLEACGQG